MHLIERILDGRASLPDSLADTIARRFAEDIVRARLLGYARKVLHHSAIDQLRRESRLRASVESEPDCSENTMSDDRIAARQLLSTLQTAPRALLLAWLEGHEAFEEERIRQELQPDAARQRVQRTLKRLRIIARAA